MAAGLLAAACAGGSSTLPVRSDMESTGEVALGTFNLSGNVSGSSSGNSFEIKGINAIGPQTLTQTSFGKIAGVRTETESITDQLGRPVSVEYMTRRAFGLGYAKSLQLQVGYFQQISVLGQTLCGAKIKLDFQPNAWQFLTSAVGRRAWEAQVYYSIPCSAGALPDTPTVAASPIKAHAPPSPSPTPSVPSTLDPAVHMDIAHAKMISLTITQQVAPRLLGKPFFVNGGNSVTLIGGSMSRLVGGWWENPLTTQVGANVVGRLVANLSQHGWQGFSNGGYGTLLYTAGDADTFLSWKKLVLNRQNGFLVNFRTSPSAPWHHLGIERIYDYGWNDWDRNWRSFFGSDPPPFSDLVNDNGTLKGGIDKNQRNQLVEIRSSGCQNCPNPSLSQIRFTSDGHAIYADTIRGFVGATSSLLMIGNVPNISPSAALNQAERIRQQEGAKTCPLQRSQTGAILPKDQQLTSDQCAQTLINGALWRMLVTDPSKYGLDEALQFKVQDTSTVTSECQGKGDDTFCQLVTTDTRLDANYGYTSVGAKALKAWIVNQLLGPVGANTSGLGYAQGPSTGSGVLLALAQPIPRMQYYSNLKPTPLNYALLFALDTPGLTAPGILSAAAHYLGYPN